MAAFRRVQPQHPNYVDARLQIVMLLESQERFDEALVEIERLRTLRPDRQVEFHAATLRIQQGDFEGGVALLEGLLNGSEEDAEVYYQLGMQYGTKGDSDESLRYMQRVLELDPNNANALNYIGYSWAERGENLDEAEELIRKAMALSPDDGYITDSLGWVYYKMAENLFEASRKEEALRLLEQAHEQLVQAAELTGGDSVVSEHLGDVLLLKGDKSGALDYYEESADQGMRESEQPQLLEKLERLRRDLGRDSDPQPGGDVDRRPQGGTGQGEAQ
jgi:Flp pilus assembly protein TadD